MAAVRRIPPAFAQSFDKRLRSSVGFRPNDSLDTFARAVAGQMTDYASTVAKD